MKPIFHVSQLGASEDNEFTSLLNVGAETLPDLEYSDDLDELTSIVEDLTSRDLEICSRIVLAVIEMTERLGAAATNTALTRAVRDIERASMI
jgi:serine/threonine protein kinase HipA of HipAB toxin-antitoxin module